MVYKYYTYLLKDVGTVCCTKMKYILVGNFNRSLFFAFAAKFESSQETYEKTDNVRTTLTFKSVHIPSLAILILRGCEYFRA